MEGAFVSSVLAEKEREKFFVDAVHRDAVDLEAEGALAEPKGLGHFVDEHFFGGAGGLVLGQQGLAKGFERGGILARDDERAGSESIGNIDLNQQRTVMMVQMAPIIGALRRRLQPNISAHGERSRRGFLESRGLPTFNSM